jgi:hypothetical protein
VSKRIRIVSLALERRELVFRQWLEEAIRYLEFAAIGTELALHRTLRNSGEAGHGSLAAHDHDLLAGLGTLDQAGDMCVFAACTVTIAMDDS